MQIQEYKKPILHISVFCIFVNYLTISMVKVNLTMLTTCHISCS